MYTIKNKKEVIQIIEEETQVTLNEYIGFKIKEFREARNMKQIDLSRATCPRGTNIPDVSTSLICRMEKGLSSPRVDSLAIFADILGVSISDFIPTRVA